MITKIKINQFSEINFKKQLKRFLKDFGEITTNTTFIVSLFMFTLTTFTFTFNEG